MKTDNLLLIIAIIAVVVSIAGVFLTYNSVVPFKNMISGFVTYGTVNLTVESTANINFTTSNLNFGSGSVTAGKTFAVIASNNTITDGNWTAVTSGFIVENIGNVNLSLSIASQDTAATLLGGDNPLYMYNVSNQEAGSCNGTASSAIATYYNLATSPIEVCDRFLVADASDAVRIDILMKIPSNSFTGPLSDIITATITAG